MKTCINLIKFVALSWFCFSLVFTPAVAVGKNNSFDTFIQFKREFNKSLDFVKTEFEKIDTKGNDDKKASAGQEDLKKVRAELNKSRTDFEKLIDLVEEMEPQKSEKAKKISDKRISDELKRIFRNIQNLYLEDNGPLFREIVDTTNLGKTLGDIYTKLLRMKENKDDENRRSLNSKIEGKFNNALKEIKRRFAAVMSGRTREDPGMKNIENRIKKRNSQLKNLAKNVNDPSLQKSLEDNVEQLAEVENDIKKENTDAGKQDIKTVKNKLKDGKKNFKKLASSVAKGEVREVSELSQEFSNILEDLRDIELSDANKDKYLTLIDALPTETMRKLFSEMKDIIYPGRCSDKHMTEELVETECDFYVDFHSGVEIMGDSEFSDVFPRVMFRSRSVVASWDVHQEKEELYDIRWGRRLHAILDFALTSRNVQGEGGSVTAGLPNLEGAKSLEGRGGILLDLVDLYKDEKPLHTVGFIGELGFSSPEEIKDGSGNTLSKPKDLSENHFVGLRLYHRWESFLNGAYLDLGWGVSERFRENEYKRFKVRGYLPYHMKNPVPMLFGLTSPKVFAAFEVDSDFASGEDEVKLIFGISIGFSSLTNILGMAGGGQAGSENP